jgi:serine/threonine protein phosphatase PrpC
MLLERWKMKLKVHEKKFKGRKEHYEDFSKTDKRGGIFILADGWTGDHPETAKTAVNSLYSLVKAGVNGADYNVLATRVPEWIEETNSLLIDQGKREGWDMRTTLDLVLMNDFQFTGWHIGDSRVYGVHTIKGPKQLTTDHTRAQKRIDSKRLDPDYGKFEMDSEEIPPGPTNYLGASTYDIERFGPTSLAVYDRLFMTTDGLPDMMTDSELLEILAMNTKEALKTMDSAYQTGGSIHAFLHHSPRVVGWVTEEMIVSKGKTFDEYSKIKNLINEMEDETVPHYRMELVKEHMKDADVYSVFERVGKEYLAQRDNWTRIMIEIGR